MAYQTQNERENLILQGRTGEAGHFDFLYYFFLIPTSHKSLDLEWKDLGFSPCFPLSCLCNSGQGIPLLSGNRTLLCDRAGVQIKLGDK